MTVQKKTEIIRIRATPTQVDRFREGAAKDGRRLSEWLRELAQREIRSQRTA
jgi:hypothetical protein